MARIKNLIEYRYYEIPSGHYVSALLGEQWEKNYGHDVVNKLHFHNYLELGYCYWGKGVLTIEKDEIPYEGEICTIIPANIPHTTLTDGEGIDKWEFAYIDIEGFIRNEMNFRRALPEDVIKRVNKAAQVVSWKDNAVLSAAIIGILNEYRLQNHYYRDAVKGHLYTLVIELLRISDNSQRNISNDFFDNKKMNKYIEASVEFIANNYKNDVKMMEIAEVCGLSESHFRRIFEESMGMKPLDYLNMVRIDKACELLENEDIAMEEVGFRVGYETPSTFNRNFKKLTGKTPYQWKKEESHLNGAAKNYKISARKGW